MLESEDAKIDRMEAETPCVTIIPSDPSPEPAPSLPGEEHPNRLLLMITAVVALILAAQLITMVIARYHRPRAPINAAPLLLDDEQEITLPDN